MKINVKNLSINYIQYGEGNDIVCGINNYKIHAYNNSTNMNISISKINDDINDVTFTDLKIRGEEVKYLDNKYLETDLILQNSISLGRAGDIGSGSSAIGRMVEASGDTSHAEGDSTIASGTCSHAEGGETIVSGIYSHAEGTFTTASGGNSHVEGSGTSASGNYSHAEGHNNTASGESSHAEGTFTTASGDNSHVEGNHTTASGNYSHAEGNSTIAAGKYQHVQGKYNIEDTENKYAHIVGNGSGTAVRSNAHTLDWNGNGWYAGKLSQEGTPTNDKDLITKKYFDENKDSYTLSFKENGNLLVTIGDVTKEFAPAGSGGATISYIVHYELTDCTSSNTATTINHGDSYTTTLSATAPRTLQAVAIIMGGIDITSTAYNPDTKTVTINTVTGNISITASAAAPTVGQISSDSKDITLSNLPAGTYTLKYESDEGVIDGFDPIGNVEVK